MSRSSTSRHFDVPPFLLPIYQAAGAAYDIPWQVLAAINEVETELRHEPRRLLGRCDRLDAVPAEHVERRYGVDASGTGAADPYNAADAIFSAARTSPPPARRTNLPAAIYAYNHSDAYVQSVLLRAELLSGEPSDPR